MRKSHIQASPGVPFCGNIKKAKEIRPIGEIDIEDSNTCITCAANYRKVTPIKDTTTIRNATRESLQVVDTGVRIKCGRCQLSHPSVEAVKDCFAGIKAPHAPMPSVTGNQVKCGKCSTFQVPAYHGSAAEVKACYMGTNN